MLCAIVPSYLLYQWDLKNGSKLRMPEGDDEENTNNNNIVQQPQQIS